VFLASDYPFLDILWTMLVFFGWVIWFWLLITVFADLFRRHDVSGWAKAGWIVLCIVLPFIGVLFYLGTQGKGMAERNVKDVEAQRAQLDSYIRETAGGGGGGGGGGAAAEIGRAKELLDKGAISQAEYDQIKQRALA
jgi:hypothetical protein